MTEITDEDKERVNLLRLVTSSKNEFKTLSLDQISRLSVLLEKKIILMIKKLTNPKKNY